MSETLHPDRTRMPEEKLLSAIYENDVEQARHLLSQLNTSHPMFRASRGKLLCSACIYSDGSLDMIEALLDHGCDPGVASCGMRQDSPLHLAAKQGFCGAVDLLLQRGADPRTVNRFGETALHCAAQAGHAVFHDDVIKWKQFPPYWPFVRGIHRSPANSPHKDVVHVLLKSGCDIDTKDCGDCTPLFHAVTEGKELVVRLLIKEGANVDAVNDDLLSPLNQALTLRHVSIIALLLRAGCRLDSKEGYIYYKAHYSNSIAYSLGCIGDVDLLRLLVECGGNIQHVDHMPTDTRASIETLLHEFSIEPRTCQSLSRQVIRSRLNGLRQGRRLSLETLIDRLPLPGRLRDYLAIRDAPGSGAESMATS